MPPKKNDQTPLESLWRKQENWANSPTVRLAAIIALIGMIVSAILLFLTENLLFLLTGFLSVCVFVVMVATRRDKN